MIDFKNADCIAGLKEYPDKYFDLAIVDPPYGDGLGKNGGGAITTGSGASLTSTSEQTQTSPFYNRFGGRFNRYKKNPRKAPSKTKKASNDGAVNGRPNTRTTS